MARCRKGHSLESAFVDTLNASRSGLFLHWGAYGAGKSVAAESAALRLQNACGRTAIVLHGYDFIYDRGTAAWLRQSVGVPPDLTATPLSAFFRRPTTLILDHFDLMVRDARIEDTLECLRDLARESAATQKFNVLLLLTSWERALELRDAVPGSRLIASPSRWTETELNTLYNTLPQHIQGKWASQPSKQSLPDLMRLAALAGTPGYLAFAAQSGFACPQQAARLDLEWRKGSRALALSEKGERSDETGTFPDRNGIFNHGYLFAFEKGGSLEEDSELLELR